MFKIVISQLNLKSIISAVSHITSEVKFQLSPDGLKIEAVDPASVAMVKLDASTGAFDYFQADSGQIAMDLTKLAALTAHKDAPVSIELEEETHKLKIAVGKAKYTMSLLDPSSLHATPRIPTLDLPAAVALPGSELREAISSATKVADHIIIEQHDSEFKISAKGDIDAFEMPMNLTEMLSVRHGESRALFSLDYMEDIGKVAAGSDNVMIETGIDYPMKVTFNLGESINVQYLLAPRIENDN